MSAALGRAFGGIKMVFERFGFPEDDLEKMSNGLVEVLQQADADGEKAHAAATAGGTYRIAFGPRAARRC